MRILLIKTSSLGDLIHSFPAITDATKAISGVEFHWLVEESFLEVPGWHPAVKHTIPIALRRWRKEWRQAWNQGALGEFKRLLRAHEYDLVIDAQGLIAKSAIPGWLARGKVHGFDRASAREPLASLLYQHKHRVSKRLHAIERVRHLFAASLGYQVPSDFPEYGLETSQTAERSSRQLVLLHSTTWPSKHWPNEYWVDLVRLAEGEGFDCCLPWATKEERMRAEEITGTAGGGRILDRMDLSRLKEFISVSAGCVGLDSGLAHIAAAVETPSVTLYGPTSVGLTGAIGRRQQNLASEFSCAPCMQRVCSYEGESKVKPACFQSLSPGSVWNTLKEQMNVSTGGKG